MRGRENPQKTEEGHDAISKTIRFWETRYGQPISREEARQIIEMMTGFFIVLQEWESSLES